MKLTVRCGRGEAFPGPACLENCLFLGFPRRWPGMGTPFPSQSPADLIGFLPGCGAIPNEISAYLDCYFSFPRRALSQSSFTSLLPETVKNSVFEDNSLFILRCSEATAGKAGNGRKRVPGGGTSCQRVSFFREISFAWISGSPSAGRH